MQPAVPPSPSTGTSNAPSNAVASPLPPRIPTLQALQSLQHALPDALPTLASRPRPLPVTVDAPARIEGGWPQPEATGLLTGRCLVGDAPQGWTREDIVGAVLKVSFEDWQGGMPLASSRQIGEYKRLASGPGSDGDETAVVYQRDEFDCLTGRPHGATLALGSQRASGAAPRVASLQTQAVAIDRTGSTESVPGAVQHETWQTRKLLRREYHAGTFELCLAVNAESLRRLRADGELVFFAGSDDPTYPLALRRATLSITYGERRVDEGGVESDTEILGGLASMAGRWRLPDGSST